MSAKNGLSVDLVRQSVREENGHLYWLPRSRERFSGDGPWKTWNKRFAGKEAGYRYQHKKSGDVRWFVCIEYVMMLRYQVVWLLHHGEWPGELDHKNRNSLDDNISNLRPATQTQNLANASKSSRNTSGFKGVQWRQKTKAWIAKIRANGKNNYLGQFADPAEAHAAYVAAAERFYGEFACAG